MRLAKAWGYLHDGCIEQIDGSVPGELTVHVSIGYLRARFPSQGTGFVLRLAGCTLFEYEQYDEPVCGDLQRIVQYEPAFVSLKSDEPTIVQCSMGVLRMDYSALSICLDTGEPVTLADLHGACTGYWAEWKERMTASKAAQGK